MTDMAVSSGGFPWITLVVFLPLVGVIAIVLAKEELAKWIGFAASSVVLLVSLPLWGLFNETTSAMQFEASVDRLAIHQLRGWGGWY